MKYNEYDYQKENNILIKKKTRAEGLNKILYQCPHCLKESKMASSGEEIYCEECGKRWRFNEDGTLTVKFKEKVRAVTPGQAIAFYVGNILAGGGKIEG